MKSPDLHREVILPTPTPHEIPSGGGEVYLKQIFLLGIE